MKQIEPFKPTFHLSKMASELKWDIQENLRVLKTNEGTTINSRVI